MNPKVVTILQHSSIVRPYALYALLKKLNVELRLHSFTTPLHALGWVPPTEESPIILLGGPQSVYEVSENPWLHEEFTFVKRCLDKGHPAFGICLGGQILSHVLGAQVCKSSHPEVGWYPIKIAKDADCLGLEEGEQHFFQWHFDTFQIPPDARPLFEGGNTCRNQGYIWNDQVLSIQFHPEMTLEGMNLLKEKFAIPAGTSLECSPCIQTEFGSYFAKAHLSLELMLSWFLKKAA